MASKVGPIGALWGSRRPLKRYGVKPALGHSSDKDMAPFWKRLLRSHKQEGFNGKGNLSHCDGALIMPLSYHAFVALLSRTAVNMFCNV